MYFGIEKCLQKKIKEYKNGGVDPDQYIPPKASKTKPVTSKKPIEPPYLPTNLLNAPTSSSKNPKMENIFMPGDITKLSGTNPWIGERLPEEMAWALGADHSITQQDIGGTTVQRPTKRAKKGEGKAKGKGSGKKGSSLTSLNQP